MGSQGFRFTDLDQLALWGVDRKALGVGMPNSPWVNGDLMGFIDDSGGV